LLEVDFEARLLRECEVKAAIAPAGSGGDVAFDSSHVCTVCRAGVALG
jgi:hypothetical protein